MNKFDAKAISQAMGPRPLDTLEVVNQWARVRITRDSAAGQPDAFIVDGDIADSRARAKGFTSLTEAMSYALRSLAEFQNGRAD